jgi:hypothetical protein
LTLSDAASLHRKKETGMTNPRRRPDPRQQPGSEHNDDPDLGQKEAEREKAELEKEEEGEDELEPMERPEQR